MFSLKKTNSIELSSYYAHSCEEENLSLTVLKTVENRKKEQLELNKKQFTLLQRNHLPKSVWMNIVDLLFYRITIEGQQENDFKEFWKNVVPLGINNDPMEVEEGESDQPVNYCAGYTRDSYTDLLKKSNKSLSSVDQLVFEDEVESLTREFFHKQRAFSPTPIIDIYNQISVLKFTSHIPHNKLFSILQSVPKLKCLALEGFSEIDKFFMLRFPTTLRHLSLSFSKIKGRHLDTMNHLENLDVLELIFCTFTDRYNFNLTLPPVKVLNLTGSYSIAYKIDFWRGRNLEILLLDCCQEVDLERLTRKLQKTQPHFPKLKYVSVRSCGDSFKNTSTIQNVAIDHQNRPHFGWEFALKLITKSNNRHLADNIGMRYLRNMFVESSNKPLPLLSSPYYYATILQFLNSSVNRVYQDGQQLFWLTVKHPHMNPKEFLSDGYLDLFNKTVLNDNLFLHSIDQIILKAKELELDECETAHLKNLSKLRETYI